MSGLSSITVNKGTSGLGRRLLSPDGVGGIIFYNNAPPTGFSTDNVRKVFSLQEAEALGIVSTSPSFDVDHYQVSEFFRVNPSGQLWVGYFAVPATTYDFTEINDMMTVSQGEIRLLGIYAPLLAFDSAQVTAIQALVTAQDSLNRPVNVFYGAGFDAVADLSTLSDLRTLNAPDVHVVIGQDGAGLGATLFASKSFSITALGAVMGATSRASVAQSPGNPENFNLSGAQLTVAAFANGQTFDQVGPVAAGAIKDKGYTILRNYLPGISGTYVERIPAAVPFNNDFAFQENRRVAHKAHRLFVAAYQPQLNSAVQLNADGTISDIALEDLKDIGDRVLEQMRTDGNISAGQTLIDPAQDLLATSTLAVSAEIVPLGTLEKFTININLVNALT